MHRMILSLVISFTIVVIISVIYINDPSNVASSFSIKLKEFGFRPWTLSILSFDNLSEQLISLFIKLDLLIVSPSYSNVFEKLDLISSVNSGTESSKVSICSTQSSIGSDSSVLVFFFFF